MFEETNTKSFVLATAEFPLGCEATLNQLSDEESIRLNYAPPYATKSHDDFMRKLRQQYKEIKTVCIFNGSDANQREMCNAFDESKPLFSDDDQCSVEYLYVQSQETDNKLSAIIDFYLDKEVNDAFNKKDMKKQTKLIVGTSMGSYNNKLLMKFINNIIKRVIQSHSRIATDELSTKFQSFSIDRSNHHHHQQQFNTEIVAKCDIDALHPVRREVFLGKLRENLTSMDFTIITYTYRDYFNDTSSKEEFLNDLLSNLPSNDDVVNVLLIIAIFNTTSNTNIRNMDCLMDYLTGELSSKKYFRLTNADKQQSMAMIIFIRRSATVLPITQCHHDEIVESGSAAIGIHLQLCQSHIAIVTVNLKPNLKSRWRPEIDLEKIGRNFFFKSINMKINDHDKVIILTSHGRMEANSRHHLRRIDLALNRIPAFQGYIDDTEDQDNARNGETYKTAITKGWEIIRTDATPENFIIHKLKTQIEYITETNYLAAKNAAEENDLIDEEQIHSPFIIIKNYSNDTTIEEIKQLVRQEDLCMEKLFYYDDKVVLTLNNTENCPTILTDFKERNIDVKIYDLDTVSLHSLPNYVSQFRKLKQIDKWKLKIFNEKMKTRCIGYSFQPQNAQTTSEITHNLMDHANRGRPTSYTAPNLRSTYAIRAMNNNSEIDETSNDGEALQPLDENDTPTSSFTSLEEEEQT